MNAKDVKAALARKFCAPAHAIFYEVAEGTGAAGGRYADAVAMSLWPSRGCELMGFEIKVSRQDWLNELRQPEKSMPIQRHMDRWWIVTPPGIVKADELPPTWGLYEVKGNGLHCITQAPKLDREPPSPHFLAALLRRAHEHAAKEIHEGVKAAMIDERLAIAAEVDRQVKELSEHRARSETAAQEKLAAIEKACGLEPDRWLDGPGIGAAIGLVHRLGITASYNTIETAASAARNFADAHARLKAQGEGAE
jgi:hypothetical protein